MSGAAPPSVRPPGPEPALALRAIVADPSAHWRGLLCRQLARAGYATSEAADLEAALRQARALRPSLIVSELWFDGTGGVTVVERWKAALPCARLVVVTGFADIASAVAAIRRGAGDVLTKPVSASELLATAWDRPAAPSDEDEQRPLTMKEATETYLRMVVTSCSTLAEAARQLGLERRSLRRILARYDWASRWQRGVGRQAAKAGGEVG